MVPIQTIVLLLLVISGQLPLGTGSTTMPTTQAAPAGHALAVVLSLVLSHALLVAYVVQRTGVAVRRLHETTMDSALITGRVEHLMSIARWTTIIILAVHLYGLGLRGIVDQSLAHTVLLQRLYAAEALILAPTLLAWLVLWIAAYRLDSAVRQRALPFRLAQGLPVHDMPSLGRYLSMQLRHNLFPVAPLVFYGYFCLAGEALARWIPHADEVAGPVAAGIIALSFPWFLTKAWSTTPLTGPLRARLDAVAQRYHLRFRNILVWHTHNVVTNAAILGYLPFARYFFMTDALLETLTDDQLEAVFAHEVGHGVHWHVPWYLAAFMGANVFAGSVAALTDLLAGPRWTDGMGDQVLILALIGLFLGVGFPFFSHRFEHQADWFAARHMGRVLGERLRAGRSGARTIAVELVLPLVPTPVEQVTLAQYAAGEYPHAPGSAAASPAIPAAGTGGDLLPEGAALFNSALDTLVELSHRARNRRGWMHPSINRRTALLRRLAVDPAAVHGFEQKMRRTRWLIVGLAAVGVSLGVLAWRATPGTDSEPAATQPATQPHSSILT